MTIFATQQAKFRRMCPNLTRWCGRAQKNCCWTLQKCENATETSACLACCEGTAAVSLNGAMNLHGGGADGTSTGCPPSSLRVYGHLSLYLSTIDDGARTAARLPEDQSAANRR